MTSHKINNLKWESISLDDFSITMSNNFEGFGGLEQCVHYGLDKEPKKHNKINKRKKKYGDVKKHIRQLKQRIDNDKIKLTEKILHYGNVCYIEPLASQVPSLTNIPEVKVFKKEAMRDKSVSPDTNLEERIIQTNGSSSNKKLKLGLSETTSNLTPEDMLSWAEYKLQEPIMKALMELGFKTPTRIQELTLPTAIHGRRDIIGAAETGSGKTLAFGLPILSGIMTLKQKADLGIDVYNEPYKKTSIKKKSEEMYKKQCKNECASKMSKVTNHNREKESFKNTSSDGDQINEEKLTTEEQNSSDVNSVEEHLEDAGDEDSLDNYENTEEDSDDDLNKIETTDDDDDDGCSNQSEMSEEQTEEASPDIGCVKVIDDVDTPMHEVTKTGKPLYALILTPTRELAIQVSRHLIAVAKYTGIRIATIVGGMAAVKQERELRYSPEVVVATPGRLWELINQGEPHLQQLQYVKFLAIDETDRMVERGHFEELQLMLERLNADEACRSTRQNFVFSATLTMVHDLPAHMRGKKVTKRGKIINRNIQKMTPELKIKRLVAMIGITNPKVIDTTAENFGTSKTLREFVIQSTKEDKDIYLYYVLRMHPGRTIVFSNSIGNVKRLAQLLTVLKCRPIPLHAFMAQRTRLRNLERFRDDPCGILVASDVAARGLDIPNVDHVIHYDVPRTAEQYVHRSGRTARANKEGLTILITDTSDIFLYRKLCSTLHKESELPPFPVSQWCLSQVTQLVKSAQSFETVMRRLNKEKQSVAWHQMAAEKMDIICDEDESLTNQIIAAQEKEYQARKRHLESLLSKPLFSHEFAAKSTNSGEPTITTSAGNLENPIEALSMTVKSERLKKRKSKNSSLLKLQNTF
ncbi:hypothetical protein ACJJTC_007024 [Scirpophaga incertulas]